MKILSGLLAVFTPLLYASISDGEALMKRIDGGNIVLADVEDGFLIKGMISIQDIIVWSNYIIMPAVNSNNLDGNWSLSRENGNVLIIFISLDEQVKLKDCKESPEYNDGEDVSSALAMSYDSI